MRVGGSIAVPWVDYQRLIAETDDVPEDAVLVRNQAGNLAIVSPDDEYLGFIDTFGLLIDLVARRT